MNDIERLAAIEAIKQAKAWYFYGLDHRDWGIWRERVWAPDGRLEVPEVDMVVEPLETVIEWVAAQTGDQVSVHHGHMPIIDFVSDDEAKVIWAMEDRLYRKPGEPLHDLRANRGRLADKVEPADPAAGGIKQGLLAPTAVARVSNHG
jgi:hypothetical protein